MIIHVEFDWVIAKGHQVSGYVTAKGGILIRQALEPLKLQRILAAYNPPKIASEHILRDKLRNRLEHEVTVRPNY